MFLNRAQLCIVLTICMLMVAACNGGGGNDEDIQLPTRVDANSADGGQQEDSPESGVTPTAPPESPSGRPTLPPSWTPTTAPTLTLTSTPTVAPTQAVVTTLEACGTFRIDRERSTSEFRLGESPTVAWTNVDGASFYRIRLFDSIQSEISLDPLSSTETSLVINYEFFTVAGRFGWTVEPIGADGVQMCTGMGESFIVSG
ncbi:MAG: hypothetical protein RLP44_02750 [Aggregatilineales bacterium]